MRIDCWIDSISSANSAAGTSSGSTSAMMWPQFSCLSILTVLTAAVFRPRADLCIATTGSAVPASWVSSLNARSCSALVIATGLPIASATSMALSGETSTIASAILRASWLKVFSRRRKESSGRSGSLGSRLVYTDLSALHAAIARNLNPQRVSFLRAACTTARSSSTVQSFRRATPPCAMNTLSLRQVQHGAELPRGQRRTLRGVFRLGEQHSALHHQRRKVLPAPTSRRAMRR